MHSHFAKKIALFIHAKKVVHFIDDEKEEEKSC